MAGRRRRLLMPSRSWPPELLRRGTATRTGSESRLRCNRLWSRSRRTRSGWRRAWWNVGRNLGACWCPPRSTSGTRRFCRKLGRRWKEILGFCYFKLLICKHSRPFNQTHLVASFSCTLAGSEWSGTDWSGWAGTCSPRSSSGAAARSGCSGQRCLRKRRHLTSRSCNASTWGRVLEIRK